MFEQIFGGTKNNLFFVVFIIAILSFALFTTIQSFACDAQQNANNDAVNSVNKDDISIIYTNDVHGASTQNIGFDGLYDFKNKIKEKTDNILTVDSGDEVSGTYMAKVTNGMFAADMMNKIGYDFATLGNHEADITDDQLQNYISKSNCKFLSCNNDVKNTMPYKIADINNKKIGFIGVSYTEDVKNAKSFYGTVQTNIDKVKSEGAQIVILLAHLGIKSMVKNDLASDELAKNIKGADIIIDGHTHSNIPDLVVNNIHITQAGSYLRQVGLLKISPDNNISFNMIKEYKTKDKEFTKFIEEKKQEADSEYANVMAKTDDELKYNGEGCMYSCSREDGLGNLLADSFKDCLDSDCAFVNATSYRSNIPKGEVTKENFCDLFPFAGPVYKVELKGQQIVDALENACMYTEKEYQDSDGNPVGTSSSFLQVSGVKFKINTSILSSVKLKDRKNFDGVSGERRVHDVKINEENIELNKTYTLATSKYLADGGCGMTMIAGSKVLDSKDNCSEVVQNYINDVIKGKTSEYLKSKERIIIE